MMFPGATPPPDMVAEGTGVDCPGNDLKEMDADFNTCAEECTSRRHCVGFVYSEFADAQAPCVLKTEAFCENKVKQPDTWAYRKSKFTF